MDAPRIVVVGSTMIDLIAYADRLPGDGETVVGSSYETGFGGKGANQAVMAARFGAAVSMVNTLGDDAHGTAYLERLGAEGIDTTFIRRVPGSSGVAPIWVDRAGTNRIIVVPGANGEVRPDVAAEAVESFRPQVVLGQFEIPQPATAAGFAAARRIGAVTVLNPAPAAPVEPDLHRRHRLARPERPRVRGHRGRTPRRRRRRRRPRRSGPSASGWACRSW